MVGTNMPYDPKLEFSLKLADPPNSKRALASFYDEWEGLSYALDGMRLKGAHKALQGSFDEDLTPLLVGETANGSIPMALANYPEAGRAVWVFTDRIWQLAQRASDDVSRDVYQKLISSTMSWLARQS